MKNRRFAAWNRRDLERRKAFYDLLRSGIDFIYWQKADYFFL